MDANYKRILFLVGFLFVWSIEDVSSIAGKFPAYSLQNMPRTDFTCRDKILGGYYADAETQCQMFHVCVKVAGVGVQDFRFLCPNGTAFDQEAQTCADWGDVDCEQATLYYGSDNFDLYRIGSGYESKRAPFAEEDEAIFHLQRAESNDARRSKESIVNQNQMNRQDKQVTFNHKQQHSQQQQQQRIFDDVVSIRPSKQYTPQQNKQPELPQSIPSSSTRVKITSTTQAYVTSRPTVAVASQSKQSNYYNNDEIFKGSHSSNFYSNRNSNADDDDEVRRISNGGRNNNAKKSRQRNNQRGRSQYRSTPSTTKATTPSTTYRPPSTYATPKAFSVTVAAATSARPTFASSSTPPNAYFTTIKTTTSEPFKFTFTPSVVHSGKTGTQENQFARQSNSYNAVNGGKSSIGPLQQQYQQSNYHTGPQYTTANNFNGVSTTTQPHVPHSIVSVPTPFNTNNNQNNQQTNNNFFGNQPNTNANGRFFDNNNPINNYQTTSPFTSSQLIYNQNQFFGNNRTATPTTAALQASSSQFGFNNNASNVQQQNFLPFLSNQRSGTTAPSTTKVPTVAPVQTQHSSSTRKPFNEEPPNFKQQDFLSFYQTEQQRYNTQSKNQITSTEKNRRFEQQPFTEAARLEQQRRLHYDINDYLTTSKFNVQNQYSPTSEQYRSVHTFPTHAPPVIKNQLQKFNENRQQSTPTSTSTASAPKQQYEPYKQYHDLQRQHARQTSTSAPAISKSYDPPLTKKFSTLVPKEYYAPTTFKPSYYNVAKQINDNLSFPPKYFTNSTQSVVTTTTTSRTVPNVSQQQNRPNTLPSPAPTTNFFQTKSVDPAILHDGQYHPEAIDEDDGQYHPELYEQDFARNKLKNKRKQKLAQQQQQQHPRHQFQEKFDKNDNYRGTSNSFAGSSNEEFLNTAHSQNIAASGNELRAEHAAKYSASFDKHSTTRQPSGNAVFGSSQNGAKSQSTSLKLISKAPTIPPGASIKKTPIAQGQSDKEKDASYDYAYYDTGFNDAVHEYSEYDVGDFGKTKKSKN